MTRELIEEILTSIGLEKISSEEDALQTKHPPLSPDD